ncbi:hypothetical protein [Streptomyces lydicus]|uniref:hypothetical protein n=1 Tax=Streptomyces lydicus TaxID=47763 RepID=UPI00379D3F1F
MTQHPPTALHLAPGDPEAPIPAQAALRVVQENDGIDLVYPSSAGPVSEPYAVGE